MGASTFGRYLTAVLSDVATQGVVGGPTKRIGAYCHFPEKLEFSERQSRPVFAHLNNSLRIRLDSLFVFLHQRIFFIASHGIILGFCGEPGENTKSVNGAARGGYHANAPVKCIICLVRMRLGLDQNLFIDLPSFTGATRRNIRQHRSTDECLNHNIKGRTAMKYRHWIDQPVAIMTACCLLLSTLGPAFAASPLTQSSTTTKTTTTQTPRAAPSSRGAGSCHASAQHCCGEFR